MNNQSTSLVFRVRWGFSKFPKQRKPLRSSRRRPLCLTCKERPPRFLLADDYGNPLPAPVGGFCRECQPQQQRSYDRPPFGGEPACLSVVERETSLRFEAEHGGELEDLQTRIWKLEAELSDAEWYDGTSEIAAEIEDLEKQVQDLLCLA